MLLCFKINDLFDNIEKPLRNNFLIIYKKF